MDAVYGMSSRLEEFTNTALRLQEALRSLPKISITGNRNLPRQNEFNHATKTAIVRASFSASTTITTSPCASATNGTGGRQALASPARFLFEIDSLLDYVTISGEAQ